MPHILEVIDETHISIVKPHENQHAYMNRKGYHSINVQIVCDHTLKIIGVVARFPGSTHDAFLWRQSALAHKMKGSYEAGDRDSRLIGDSGYPCLPWLLVPLRNPTTPQEINYNSTIKVARSCVERCIGVLKGKFRCLLRDRTLHYTPQCARRIIMTCAVLHKITKQYNISDAVPLWDDIDNEQYRQLGNQYRQTYLQNYF
ncbi:hypothetical protein MML48_9g00005386 [Holotrichia oblita]|uniref:Uncharacterized protein n=1 Tax=Holotrichia oblita TaxID=644536 RepID=A0ACB9STU3_HOLOL|nr:hypothetical protein MML48_9g00005386 [Holotrichia oblita]